MALFTVTLDRNERTYLILYSDRLIHLMIELCCSFCFFFVTKCNFIRTPDFLVQASTHHYVAGCSRKARVIGLASGAVLNGYSAGAAVAARQNDLEYAQKARIKVINLHQYGVDILE